MAHGAASSGRYVGVGTQRHARVASAGHLASPSAVLRWTLTPLPPHRGEQENMKITPIDRPAKRAPREGEARPRWATRLLRRVARSRLVRGLGIYLLVYVSWLIWGWIPLGQSLVGEVILLPINAAAAVLAWQASRRVRGPRRLVLAWRLILWACSVSSPARSPRGSTRCSGRSPTRRWRTRFISASIR